jgi:transposase-like protein
VYPAGDVSMRLELLGNTLLRTAITRNLVTFPAQIRPFFKRSVGDLQERIVQLYFVRGWTVKSICYRYSLSKAMVHKLLADWRIRAIESGYIQEIEQGNLEALTAEGQKSEGSFLSPGALLPAARRNKPQAVQASAPSNLVPGRVMAAQNTPVPEQQKFANSAPHTALIPLSEQSPASFVGRSV